MTHRASYDDKLLTEVIDLLSTVFPFFREQERAARKLGLRWEACSTPFVHREQGRVVSHVGLLEIPLVMNGERRVVGSVHGVATHPDFRRRGFYRSIVEELLDWCDGRYESLQLSTDNPEYFEPFGFRIIDECHFTADASTSRKGRAATPLEDAAILRRLLASRTPVSNILGTCDRDVFLFNEARHTLRYAEDLDAIVSCDVEDDTLKLWDVVASDIPPFAEITGRIDERFERIEVHFSPDRLDAELHAVADPRDEDVLMVRGDYPPEGLPVKLPATSRC